MKKVLALIIGFITFTAGTQTLQAQGNKVSYSLQAMLKAGQLTILNREANGLTSEGKQSIYLSAKENDGVAWLNGVEFANGTIELDIKGRDVLQQSFVGIAFHGLDASHAMDVVYFRPFNFRAADSVRKIHAVQYVSLPDFDWETLREKHNGQYEKGVIPAPGANQWFHVKIVVNGAEVKVYVNGNQQPSLYVKKLNTNTRGKLGIWVGNNSDGTFSNLTVVNSK